MEYCWAHVDVVVQRVEGDSGYRRRPFCHAATLRDDYPQTYEAIIDIAGRTIEARSCEAAGSG